ncbi:hypothetical protein QQ045_009377 [Rhodiola kirilowii]
MPSRSETLSLFRSLYRVSRQFTDYNIREYIKFRTVDAFRENRNLADAEAVFADGKAQLEVAKRQAIIHSLYPPKLRSVMELKP